MGALKKRYIAMTLAELKRNIGEILETESPDTPVKIWLWNGHTPDVGDVRIGVYTDGTRTIGIQER